MGRYLVTGGAGFIGSHIVEQLLTDGHFVRVLDNFSSGKAENLNFVTSHQPPVTNYELIRGDIRNYHTCLKSCQGIDYILHQAALRSVPQSLDDPYGYNEVNITGTLHMLNAAKEVGVKRFVFASSSAVYGNSDISPAREEQLPNLVSPYALTKLTGEYYCRIFSENFGLETVSLRYFNVFGPRQAVDDEYAVVIPKFITTLLEDQSPPVHGTGKQSRDFTYVDNVVEANILAATIHDTPACRLPGGQAGTSGQDVPRHSSGQALRTTSYHRVFNIANGKDHTILDLVDALNTIMGKYIKPVFTPLRPGDIFKSKADISSAQRVLRYTPKVSFEEGLRKTVEWFQKEKTKKVNTSS